MNLIGNQILHARPRVKCNWKCSCATSICSQTYIYSLLLLSPLLLHLLILLLLLLLLLNLARGLLHGIIQFVQEAKMIIIVASLHLNGYGMQNEDFNGIHLLRVISEWAFWAIVDLAQYASFPDPKRRPQK